MDLKVNVPQDLGETIGEIYMAYKKVHPKITKNEFVITILAQWLEPFKNRKPVLYHKDKVKLKNNIKQAITFGNKTQVQVAKEIGIDRTYLGRLISGEYEPSVKTAILITKASGYPMEKFEDIFYLEPIEE